MRETIGFIGLGALGLPIAHNLLEREYPLRVFNRTESKAAPLVARGAQLMTGPAAVATPGGVVVSVLWDDASVEGLVASPGFLEALGPGGVHVSMSTISPDAAKRVAALHARAGSAYVEAPVFGRPEAAAARKLWMPLAGAQAAKERVKPILEALGAQGIYDFGEAPGAALVVKLAGNFLIGSAARSMVEALAMAEGNGVDPRAVVAMLTTTLFTAPIYQSYGKQIAEKTVSVLGSEIVKKDLGIFLRTAASVGSQTPIAATLSGL